MSQTGMPAGTTNCRNYLTGWEARKSDPDFPGIRASRDIFRRRSPWTYCIAIAQG